VPGGGGGRQIPFTNSSVISIHADISRAKKNEDPLKKNDGGLVQVERNWWAGLVRLFWGWKVIRLFVLRGFANYGDNDMKTTFVIISSIRVHESSDWLLFGSIHSYVRICRQTMGSVLLRGGNWIWWYAVQVSHPHGGSTERGKWCYVLSRIGCWLKNGRDVNPYKRGALSEVQLLTVSSSQFAQANIHIQWSSFGSSRSTRRRYHAQSLLLRVCLLISFQFIYSASADIDSHTESVSSCQSLAARATHVIYRVAPKVSHFPK